MRAQKLYSAWNEGEEHSGIGKQHIGDAGSGGLMPEDGRAAAHKLNLNGTIIIILACCMGALTLYGMLFIVNFLHASCRIWWELCMNRMRLWHRSF